MTLRLAASSALAFAAVAFSGCAADVVVARDGSSGENLVAADEGAVPNVLLLLDTSGSMGQTFASGTPYCSLRDPDAIAFDGPAPAGGDERTRWIALQEVLTGTFQDYRCMAESRGSAAFADEYRLGDPPAAPDSYIPSDPYDASYYLDLYRPVFRVAGSDTLCAFGPDSARDTSWAKTFAARGPNGVFWGGDEGSDASLAPGVRAYAVGRLSTGAVAIDRSRDDATGDCPTSFAPGFPQASDGLLDTFRDRVRFGLMTFDTLPDASTGASAGGKVSPSAGATGNFTYFRGWYDAPAQIDASVDGGADAAPCGCGGETSTDAPACATGRPPNCSMAAFDVGARNAAAPPWDGRMVGFGGVHSLGATRVHNARLQRTLLATRTYGATPTAGLLEDAAAFLTADTLPDYAADPSIAATKCGGGVPCLGLDPSGADAGRKTSLVYVVDGEANLELRPVCTEKGSEASFADGVCPFRTPTETAADLAARGFRTYVVGVALLHSGAGASCAELSKAGSVLDQPGVCDVDAATLTTDMQACCELARLARAGGTEARFVDDQAGLKAALSDVLTTIAK